MHLYLDSKLLIINIYVSISFNFNFLKNINIEYFTIYLNFLIII